MWADAQCDGRPAEYSWRPLQKFRISIPCTSRKVWLTPAAGVPCSNSANVGERKTWTQSEFCIWQVGWLEFNIPFQHEYGYIRDDFAPGRTVLGGQKPPNMYI